MGGRGGGMVRIETHQFSGTGIISVAGQAGTDGANGQPGTAGGGGGRGAPGYPVVFMGSTVIVGAGGGGGGGRGGPGSQGGQGGTGGEGGVIFLKANENAFAGTLIQEGGSGGLSGTGGAGGTGGRTWFGQVSGSSGAAGASGTPGIAGGTGVITIQVAPERLDFWQARHFSAKELTDPALSDATADADGDGVANVLEFAFNLDPRVTDRHELTGDSGLPVTTVQATPAGPRLTVEFLRRKAAGNPGITSQAVFSSDLASAAWETAASEAVTSLDETWERVLATDPAPAGAPRRFGRVSVSVVP